MLFNQFSHNSSQSQGGNFIKDAGFVHIKIKYEANS